MWLVHAENHKTTACWDQYLAASALVSVDKLNSCSSSPPESSMPSCDLVPRLLQFVCLDGTKGTNCPLPIMSNCLYPLALCRIVGAHEGVAGGWSFLCLAHAPLRSRLPKFLHHIKPLPSQLPNLNPLPSPSTLPIFIFQNTLPHQLIGIPYFSVKSRTKKASASSKCT